MNDKNCGRLVNSEVCMHGAVDRCLDRNRARNEALAIIKFIFSQFRFFSDFFGRANETFGSSSKQT